MTPLLTRLTTASVMSLLVLVWISATIRAGYLAVETTSRRPSPPAWARPATLPLLQNLLRIVMALVGAYLILLAWDVNVTGLVASAGIVGLALSFAAQDTLGNLFAGVAILVDQPYRIDDYIVLDSGERGRVTHIGLRSTRLLTRDDEEISIPNGIMGRAKIVNESGGPHVKYRLRVPIGVAYGSDIDQVMACLLKISAEHPNVCRDPEPRIRLRTFGQSSIDFEMLVWIAEPALRGLVLHEMNCEIYRSFAREGITIPFPQRDVYIRDWRKS
jgi:MscS family membrane protein